MFRKNSFPFFPITHYLLKNPILKFLFIKKIILGQVPLLTYKQLCVFAHYDKHGLIDPYVINYLKALKEAGCSILFISGAKKLKDTEINKILPYVSKIICKRNIGMDFGSWKVGLTDIKDSDLSFFDEIILANDSVYGPLFDLNQTLIKIREKKLDICGITDSWQHCYHIQSYFIVFNKKAIQSQYFQDFWKRYRFISKKMKVVEKYEFGLSQKAIESQLQIGALCDYQAVSLKLMNDSSSLNSKLSKLIKDTGCLPLLNPSHHFWQGLISDFECPFIKVDLIRDNPDSVTNVWMRLTILQNFTNYDVSFIHGHQKRVHGSDKLPQPQSYFEHITSTMFRTGLRKIINSISKIRGKNL